MEIKELATTGKIITATKGTKGKKVTKGVKISEIQKEFPKTHWFFFKNKITFPTKSAEKKVSAYIYRNGIAYDAIQPNKDLPL